MRVHLGFVDDIYGVDTSYDDTTPWWQDSIDTGLDILLRRFGTPPPGTVVTGPGGQIISQTPGYPVTPGTGIGQTPRTGTGTATASMLPLIIGVGGAALALGVLFSHRK